MRPPLPLGRLLAAATALALAAQAALAGVTFHVKVGPAEAPAPLSGRLTISIIGPGSTLAAGEDPNNGPFWQDPDQPLIGIDVVGLTPERHITCGDTADARPIKPSELPPGEYRAAARLITNRLTSNWRHDPGNLYSSAVKFTVPEGARRDNPDVVEITLTRVTKARQWPPAEGANGAELFEVRSKLLSDFHKREVFLRAGIVPPIDPDPARKHAAVYEVPGFGGDHFGALHTARGRANLAAPLAGGGGTDDPRTTLARSAFHIVLDPESPNGHTLFADSANNGPCARALVEELIPALEAKYPLIARPEARLLRGHSSGGWSSLWLALTHPETFGAAWSSSPDPVDFTRLQLVNIYDRDNFYRTRPPQHSSPPYNPDPAHWPDTPSYRVRGKTVMTVRQEAGNEDILGPDNTAGGQWDSWFAVFGPRGSRGHPAALFDPASGAIDRAVVEQYKAYDLGHLLRAEPGRYGPILRGNVRLIVGDADDFFLNEAVTLLKTDLERLCPPDPALPGYIKVLPGRTHGSVLATPEARAFPAEMLAHLRAAAILPASGR